MLGSLGRDRLFMLLVAALVVLGPERLPGAIQWATRTLRQVRDQVNRAADHARTEFGPEFADIREGIREPLATLAELRSDLHDLATAPLLDHTQPAVIFETQVGSLTPAPVPSSHPPIDLQVT
jgi:Sec-independent protein translocase protein TatA